MTLLRKVQRIRQQSSVLSLTDIQYLPRDLILFLGNITLVHFDVLLAVYLIIILVISQLDAQNLFF